jgi:hypothetical protein
MTEMVNEAGQEAPQVTGMVDPFNEEAWVEPTPEADVPRETGDETPPKEEAKEEEAKPEVVAEAPKPWYETYGFASEDEAKTEIETLRSLKEKAPTPAEIAFANEQSKRLFEAIKEGKEDEVYQILEQKRKLSAADTMPAADALRLQLSLTHQHYTPEDVSDVMEERYALPPRPVQELHESDDDFALRENAYSQQVQKVERRMNRDAVSAREELKRINQELVLPDINKQAPENPEAAAQRSAELKALRDSYLQAFDRDFPKFTGFQVTYKDEEVEIPVAYTVDETEKAAYRARLSDFDVDEFVNSKWFNPDGSPNVVKFAQDVYEMENRDRIMQKLVNEAVNQRLAHERKKNANIHLSGPQGTLVPGGEKSHQKAQADAIWSA